MEELEILEEIETVKKMNGFMEKFDYPVVYFNKTFCCFNSKCTFVPRFIRWGVTTNYIIGLPASKGDKDAYSARGKDGAVTAYFPSALKNEKKLKEGWYKLYKYKDGFAFKRYEPIEVRYERNT